MKKYKIFINISWLSSFFPSSLYFLSSPLLSFLSFVSFRFFLYKTLYSRPRTHKDPSNHTAQIVVLPRTHWSGQGLTGRSSSRSSIATIIHIEQGPVLSSIRSVLSCFSFRPGDETGSRVTIRG